MKFTTVFTAIALIVVGGRAEAANLGMIVSPPSLMSLVILGLAVAGVTEIAAIPSWLPQVLMVLWAGSFFYAVFETKRALS
jgi:hypothetical protein